MKYLVFLGLLFLVMVIGIYGEGILFGNYLVMKWNEKK